MDRFIIITFIYLNVSNIRHHYISGHKEWINVLMLKRKVNDACRQMIYGLHQNVEPLICVKKSFFFATHLAWCPRHRGGFVLHCKKKKNESARRWRRKKEHRIKEPKKKIHRLLTNETRTKCWWYLSEKLKATSILYYVRNAFVWQWLGRSYTMCPKIES